MKKFLYFKKLTIIGFLISVLIFILLITIEIPILIAILFCISLVSIITTFQIFFEIFKLRTSIEKKEVMKVIIQSVIFLPILYFFILISYEFSQNTRIDIINNTNQTVDHWSIKGCLNLWNTNLYPKQKKTIWINLNEDCSLEIEYIQQGIKKRETIAGNLNPGLFSKIEFYIQPE